MAFTNASQKDLKAIRVYVSKTLTLLFFLTTYFVVLVPAFAQTPEDQKAREALIRDQSSKAEEVRAILQVLKEQKDAKAAEQLTKARKQLNDEAIRQYDLEKVDRWSRGGQTLGEYLVDFVFLLAACAAFPATLIWVGAKLDLPDWVSIPFAIVTFGIYSAATWGVRGIHLVVRTLPMQQH